MTPRERWLALLEKRPADRIPTDYQATPEVTARLLKDLGCADEMELWRRLHVDKRKMVEPRWTMDKGLGIRDGGLERDDLTLISCSENPIPNPQSPIPRPAPRATRHPPLPPPSSLVPHTADPQADMWGVRFRKVDYGSGAYDEPCFCPLAAAQSVEEVHAHRWPDPDDFDYNVVTASVEEDDGYWPIHSGCYEPFLLYGYMRGLQQAMEDLLLRPDIAEAILGHLFEFHYEHHRRIFEAGRGRIDLTWVAEDLGAQTGPLFSLATYRRFFLANQIKMAELARRFGVHVMYHTDGAARMFLPDLIDRVRIEVLNPIQWRCPGMERERLVADFGDRVIFHGSIDNQRTLAFGSADDVVREVRESVEIYRRARWICAPCHNLQPITPTENIMAMYETIHAMGERT